MPHREIRRAPGGLGIACRARLSVPGRWPLKIVIGLAWPAVLEQLLNIVVDWTDAYIAGHLGTVALAAVGLSGQIVNLVAVFFGALGVGATALVARAVGAGDPDQAGRITLQALLSAVVIGVVGMAFAGIGGAWMFVALGAEPAVGAAARIYLNLVALSFPAMAFLFVGNAALRGAGDTLTPMRVWAVVVFTNAALAWALSGPWGLFHLGVAGLGIAAAMARTVGAMLVGMRLWRGTPRLALPHRGLGLEWEVLKRILRVGLPAGAEQLLLQLALLNLTGVITALGTAAYAAHQIGLRVMSLSFLPGWGFAVAASTMTGQALGARQPEAGRRATFSALLLALMLMGAMGLALALGGPLLVDLFTEDPEVIRQGAAALRITALIQPAMALSFVFSGALRGAGDTHYTLLITATSIWLVRLPIALLFAHGLGWGLPGAWMGMLADFAVRAMLFGWRFMSGAWERVRV
ncbi:MATE family efflux transporter [Thermoflexus sp.]|uniref:MATE family efflux transporter n=1 Tax=Thermoflexus sp. TaxID=1969742 RepID=UPI0025F66DCB|nr:MATE family efflux transporter [Thermoflexus sp.]MDW8180799.1 MATE family efflux transporter [Anaerolineae bacterium]MCS6965063.1 MATE family efflux transporter [Thermoflexus sp.]MCS7351344.1 MATE family efflux transporter [Thermoflexus sp.]MCX7689212.1 MATE family efflux transporter [Thermoflexus sp.]MDW8185497.1 MATE family efflux transporter [Anaerolineae bacterium]